MDGVLCVADRLRHSGYQALVNASPRDTPGAPTSSPGRWNLAIEMRMSGWHSSAVPHDQMRMHVRSPWSVHDDKRIT
eukprot:966536-Pyramimonas_sp.AAC.1